MVLESLISAEMEKRPMHVFLASLLITTVCYWLAYFLFPEIASIVAIVLISMAIVSVMHQVMLIEEIEEEASDGRYSFLSMHMDVIEMYAAFFFGAVATFTFWFLVSPDLVRNALFSQQLVKVLIVRGAVPQGAVWHILLNNLGVLISAFIMSLIVGTGAVFILIWNGSVLATYIGSALVRGGLSAGFFAYALPELVAYFIGGIAGGILSAGVVRRHLKGKKFETVFRDSVGLLAVAAVVLAVSAYVEVYFLGKV